jgi:hypothetical protein
MTNKKNSISVKFHPQEWVDSPGKAHERGRKQLIPAPKRDPVTFTVPPQDGTDSKGDVYPNESYEANQLQSHPIAPNWVNDWDGPYFVTTSVLE